MTTTESGAVTRIDLSVSASVPPVALGLMGAFDAKQALLQRIAASLFDGKVQLRQRSVQMTPYIGHSALQMRQLHEMARANHKAAEEVRAVTAFHESNRYAQLARFVSQFPAEWRAPLFDAVRDDVIGIELKAGSDNRVVEVVVDRAGALHEYGLRAFKLTFSELRVVAAWMRENEERLPRRGVRLPRLRQDDSKAPAARYAELNAFFDDFPVKLRELLVAKARQQLTSIRFEETPMGDVVLKVGSQ
jgi:hypothetical protein